MIKERIMSIKGIIKINEAPSSSSIICSSDGSDSAWILIPSDGLRVLIPCSLMVCNLISRSKASPTSICRLCLGPLIVISFEVKLDSLSKSSINLSK